MPPFKKFCYRTHPREYSSWAAMWTRVRNPNREDWKLYGGRGIGVCSAWDSFAKFLKDMGLRPIGTSLDRLDSNKNYKPSNCRWATPKEQIQTRRKGHFIGEKNHQAKLTWEAVKVIRATRGYGMSSILARRFGVSRSTILKVWCNESWKGG